ncbi:TasA family protein [Alkaliphilus pronyensis]|nr:TasA family protein [Alkaliphilus pronyensis]
MRKKIIFTMMALTMAIAMVAGGTMAWFTDEADAGETTFTAGTVILEADEAVLGETVTWDNWNPGDEGTVEWGFINEGTKAINLRAKLDKGWIGIQSLEDLETFNSVLRAMARIGVEGSGDWELGIIQEGSHSPAQGTQNHFTWPKATAVPFKLTFDGEVVTYIVGSGDDAITMTYAVDEEDFNDIVITTRSTSEAYSVLVNNLMLDGIELGAENFIEENGWSYLIIRRENLGEGFVLTGESTMDWEGNRPSRSHLTYQIELGNSTEPLLSPENVDWNVIGNDNWILNLEGFETGYYYYVVEENEENVLGRIAGTYGDEADEDERTRTLSFNVYLKGEETGNEYQGAKYIFSLNAEAVQASNGAAEAMWGLEVSDEE